MTPEFHDRLWCRKTTISALTSPLISLQRAAKEMCFIDCLTYLVSSDILTQTYNSNYSYLTLFTRYNNLLAESRKIVIRTLYLTSGSGRRRLETAVTGYEG